MNKRLLLTLVLSSTVSVTALNALSVSAAEMNASSNDLMQRGEKLESDISKHQRDAQNAGQASAKVYDQGYHDGYNKAVLDLVKSKLMASPGNLNQAPALSAAPKSANNPSLKPAVNAVAQVPVTPNVMEKKSSVALNNQHWGEAVASANQAIKAHPRSAAGYINRSWAYAELGLYGEAIIDANRAQLLDKRNPLVYNNRAYAYELSGRLTEASTNYDKACQLHYQPACAAYEKISKLDSTSVVTKVSHLISKSYQKFASKQWGDVVELSTRAIKLDPSNAAAYANRAGALTELGQLPAALNDSNKALQINPQFAVAHNNQGYVYELMGKQKAAAQSYKNACELGVKSSCKDYRRIAASVASNN